MNQAEIIATAKEAGGYESPQYPENLVMDEHDLTRFAALVAAREREACAALIESTTERSRWIRGGINGTPIEPCQYAAAIRARGKP